MRQPPYRPLMGGWGAVALMPVRTLEATVSVMMVMVVIAPAIAVMPPVAVVVSIPTIVVAVVAVMPSLAVIFAPPGIAVVIASPVAVELVAIIFTALRFADALIFQTGKGRAPAEDDSVRSLVVDRLIRRRRSEADAEVPHRVLLALSAITAAQDFDDLPADVLCRRRLDQWPRQ